MARKPKPAPQPPDGEDSVIALVDDLNEIDGDAVFVTVTRSASWSVDLTVNGQSVAIRRGERTPIPRHFLPVLRDSGADFIEG